MSFNIAQSEFILCSEMEEDFSPKIHSGGIFFATFFFADEKESRKNSAQSMFECGALEAKMVEMTTSKHPLKSWDKCLDTYNLHFL